MSGNLTEAVAWALAAGLGIFLGYGDLHTDDTGIIAGLIALCACALALIRPAGAWRWGLAMGAAIIVAELYSYYAIAPRNGLKSAGSFAVLAAFVTCVGLVGAYAGVGIRKVLPSISSGG